MSGGGRLDCRRLEVRVCDVLEDGLYVDIVLGAGGEHLQLQQGRHVLRLVPGDQQTVKVVRMQNYPLNLLDQFRIQL